jgi:FKBP-type peptidyl-prolyl cis-trans isomerase SlyD
VIVERDRVVRFHYTLCDEESTPVESSRGGEPVAVLYGHGNVIPGVEEALAGRAPGDRFEVTVPPEKGYGPRREGRTERVPRKRVRGPKRLQPGDAVVIRTVHGPREVVVLKVGRTVVDVDLNHPLAGHTLVFEVEVVEVREATREELDHGHVHGPGGHHH